jgi:hypothetical protein
MADRKDRMALLSRYSKLYNDRFAARPAMNLNVEQWSADALIESYGMSYCYDLLSYYMDVSAAPNWKYFANYAQDIADKRDAILKDLEERKERRRIAEKWLSE